MPPPLIRHAHAIPAGRVSLVFLPNNLGGIASLHLNDDATSLPALLTAMPHNSSQAGLVRKLAAAAQPHLSGQLGLLATKIENSPSPLL